MQVSLRPAALGGTGRPRLKGNFKNLSRKRNSVWRWVAWAEHRLGHYTRGIPAWDRLAATLRNEGVTFNFMTHTATSQFFSWPLHFRLHLATPDARRLLAPRDNGTISTNVAQLRASRRSHFPMSRTTSDPTTQPVETIVTHSRERELSSKWREAELIRRVLNRVERRDKITTAGRAWAEPPPVPRVFSQPAATLTSVSSQMRSSAPMTLAPLQSWDDTRRPLGLPTIEIEHLTDQVIQTIDQRLIAARERLGKR